MMINSTNPFDESFSPKSREKREKEQKFSKLSLLVAYSVRNNSIPSVTSP
jgi:hypothetical protein